MNHTSILHCDIIIVTIHISPEFHILHLQIDFLTREDVLFVPTCPSGVTGQVGSYFGYTTRLLSHLFKRAGETQDLPNDILLGIYGELSSGN